MAQSGSKSSRKQCTRCQRWFERTAFPPGRARCRRCHSELGKHSTWKSTLKHKYGITLEIYDAMHEEQGRGCYFCDKPGPNRGRGKLVVDHDKETGFVRGLLCRPCNANFIDEYKDLPEDRQDFPRANAYLLRGKGEYIEGIKRRLASGG